MINIFSIFILYIKVYDLNSSGGIDAKELEKVIEALFDLKGVSKETRTGENTAVGRVRSIFTKFDKDHSQDLSEDEFVNGFLEDELVMAILVPTDQ
jgi:Ca2+-binding EF-hand superfamily protein